MKLVSFTVTAFRSITKAHKIPVGRQTVLVGPNNEGKSNLLRALVTAMRVLVRARTMALGVRGGVPWVRLAHREDLFDWSRDFPMSLQASQPTGQSEITLEFELTAAEVRDFKRDVGSDLNGTLPLRISLGPNGEATIKVVKKGPGGTALTKKSPLIAQFVSQRVNFEHIPAVRTAMSAENIVAEMVERELQPLEDDASYTNALNAIASLQQPILDRLSRSIKATLVQFLPDVRGVEVRIPTEARFRALRRSCEIVVDDGTATSLQLKGDGVQSLAALGIMRHASESLAKGKSSVIAVEEPESHLHPGAIHELKAVLRELADKHQVVLTTHNPLFVDRGHLRSNIVVRDGRARQAVSIVELRDALGVKASDNLQHAELVLVVEGECDRVTIDALLRHSSPKCRRALDSGLLALDTLAGASNLGYKVGLLRAALCSVHCFLDSDASGKNAFAVAHREGLLLDRDVNWANCSGRRESELEDLIAVEVYEDAMLNLYRVKLSVPEFKRMVKWSARMAEAFHSQGRAWDERVEREVKQKVADLVSAKPDRALDPRCKSTFDGLVSSLEMRLAEVPKSRP